MLFAALFIGCNASASSTIVGAKLNGLNNLTVEGSAPITATIDVKLTDGSVWKSTAYKFGDGSNVCVNTPDHNVSSTESFSIVAPAKVGTSRVYFAAYGNDNCAPDTMLSAGLLTSVMNMSADSYSVLSINLSIILFLFVAALAFLFHFRKKDTE